MTTEAQSKIDFSGTLQAIRAYRTDVPRDSGRDDQVSAQMVGVCLDIIAGQYTVDIADTDAFAKSFIDWTSEQGLLRFM